MSTPPVPLAINSVPYDGRPACARCCRCVGFACPVDAKNGTHNTMLARAARDRAARRAAGDPGGADRHRRRGPGHRGRGGRGRRRQPVAAAGPRRATWSSRGAIETARLLLYSASDREPDGLGNNHDQVGRHLQGHVYAGALGVFDDPVNDFVGPGPSISTNDFRHHNSGLVGGGMIANEFVPTPLGNYGYLRQAGLLGLHGRGRQAGDAPAHAPDAAGGRAGTGDDLGRLAGAAGPGGPGPARASPWRSSAGPARQGPSGAAVHRRACGGVAAGERGPYHGRLDGRPAGGPGPSGGQHQAGTCRMGTDPQGSVTDPSGPGLGARQPARGRRLAARDQRGREPGADHLRQRVPDHGAPDEGRGEKEGVGGEGRSH